MATKGPYLPNLEPFFAAGIDPKTGLPIKVVSGDKKHLKDDIKKFLRLIDEQDAVNRYVWYNLPANITSQELERMLYYKGQLCFFYDKDLEEFYFMPYALDGTIDFYTRYKTVHPVPMTLGFDDKGNKTQAEYLEKIKLKCVYDIKEGQEYDRNTSTVLLHDYTKQLSQSILPRVSVNDPLLDVMAECVPLARTARILGSGVRGVRVGDESEATNVFDANRSIEDCAMTGKPFAPIVGKVEFQELNDGAVAKGEEYMLAMQSLDNLRLSGYGINNGGLFEKKAHELQSEANINGGPVGLVLQDGLEIRQHFCEVANAIWGTNIQCESSDNVNGNNLTYEETEGDQDNGQLYSTQHD